MQRNLAQSLFQHGQIRTTVPKAKDLRAFAERLITLAKRASKGDLIARRRIHQLMGDRSFVAAEHQSAYDDMSDAKREKVFRARSGRRYRTGGPRGRLEFTAESVTHRLISTVASAFEDRAGGYLRIVKLADRRLGDQGSLAIVQLVGREEPPGSVTKPAKSARKRRTDARYAAAIKAAKQFGRSAAAVSPSESAKQNPTDVAEPAGDAKV
jgi:large subunit ribosomal protein L17